MTEPAGGSDDGTVDGSAGETADGAAGGTVDGAAGGSANGPAEGSADGPAGWRVGAGDSDTRILVIDNYDSFVYNLVQYVGEYAGAVTVRRNDAVDLAAIRDLDPDGIVVSPGPGTPREAGVSMAVWELELPILGVCLGHQALCAHLGAPVGHAPTVVHGKPSTVEHDGHGIFAGLPGRVEVGRYHSLAVDRDDLPAELRETATTVDEREVVMSVRRRDRPHVGVQFHPESILTDAGKGMIENFVGNCESASRDRVADATVDEEGDTDE